MERFSSSRRRLLTAGAASFGGLLVAGCDRLSQAPQFERFLGSAMALTYGSQRLLEAGQPLAPEYAPRDMSPTFKANGTIMPTSPGYQALMANDFKDWRLTVDGLVSHPLSLSLEQLKALPQRSQITRHDCVEGWSAIGKWTGPQLSRVLMAAGMSPRARYVVFHCADDLDGSSDGSGLYYESIDLPCAFHPQTLLAHTIYSDIQKYEPRYSSAVSTNAFGLASAGLTFAQYFDVKHHAGNGVTDWNYKDPIAGNTIVSDYNKKSAQIGIDVNGGR